MLTPLLLAAASTAPADLPLAPLGKWVSDWGETRCSVAQRYGTADKPITFGLRPSLDGKTVRVIVSRERRRSGAAHFPIQIGEVATTALGFSPAKMRREVFWINLDRARFDAFAAAPSLLIRSTPLILHLSTKGFAAATRAMDQCNANLRARWNADDAGKARVKTEAEPTIPIHKLFSPDDYPRQATWEGRDGFTAVALLIDETGAVRDCALEIASGVATLDAQSCIVLTERAKFTPARDAAGVAIRSSRTYRIRWRTP